jgi:aryl-alcohol dehydrogenase-like predicted oxidoreductase
MQTTIKRRRLGRTGLLVSELSLGAMNLRMLKSFDEPTPSWIMSWTRASI